MYRVFTDLEHIVRWKQYASIRWCHSVFSSSYVCSMFNAERDHGIILWCKCVQWTKRRSKKKKKRNWEEKIETTFKSQTYLLIDEVQNREYNSSVL